MFDQDLTVGLGEAIQCPLLPIAEIVTDHDAVAKQTKQ